jgi:hypothetical protein
MSEERKKILNMLAEGKISADEAERLLDALQHSSGEEHSDKIAAAEGKDPKYLCITVTPKGHTVFNKEHGLRSKRDQTNIRIPLQLVKAGMKLGAMMPANAKEKINDAFEKKGIDLDINNLDSKSVDEFLKALTELSIDVDDEDERVRIYCG